MNKFNPLVSVIMSAKDSEDTIRKSIESIEKQTYENIEFLIIDDGSTDSTYELICEYANRDKRIKTFKNEINIGLTKSLNKLIPLTNGSYIARQDADDYSEVDRINLQMQHIETFKLDASTSRANILNSNKKIPRYSYYLPIKLSMKYKNPFIHGTLIINKQILNNLGNYDENFYFSQDYKLFKDFLEQGYKIKTISKTLYNLNTQNNLSEKNKVKQKYFFNCARKNINP